MKISVVIAALAVLALAGCKGSNPNSDDQAWCQTHYADEATCSADAKCEWFQRKGDGKFVCRAKR
jgi:hypothetical protein